MIGVGTRLGVGDLDGNGKQYLVVACRTGLYVFFDKGYTPRLRLRETNRCRRNLKASMVTGRCPSGPFT